MKIVFKIANSANVALCSISSERTLFAKVPVYWYTEWKGLMIFFLQKYCHWFYKYAFLDIVSKMNYTLCYKIYVTRLSRMEFPNLINWTSPFPFKGC